jgi:catechol 2,3-dioxygenase-like lactoylglutathione lyase family enzyme
MPMGHYSRISRIVIDTPAESHEATVDFWRSATGAALKRFERFPEYHGGLLTEGFGLLTQQVGSGTARIHVDFHTTDVTAETARLEGLGASRVEQVADWWIMRDPAGLIFCVVPDESLNESNATHWE